MKKKFYFVLILILSFFTTLFSNSVLADTTMYGVINSSQTFPMYRNIRRFILVGIIIAVFSFVIHFIRRKSKNNTQFIYKEDYKKFKPNDKVKITFINEDGKEITQRCRIISIDSKKISFEVGKIEHKCTASKVKNIKKDHRNLVVLSIITVFLLLMAVLYSFKSKIYSKNYSNYEVEENMTDYGFSVVSDVFKE